jgi:hypothetical protein
MRSNWLSSDRRRDVTAGRRCALALVSLLVAGCSRHEPTLELRVEVSAGGHLDFFLKGRPGAHAFVVLAPPQRGDEEVLAGPVGVHCSSDISPELRRAGAGPQVDGVLGDGALEGRIDTATLAALPSPMVLQAVASAHVDGRLTALTSDGIVVESSAGTVTVRPFTTTWAIVRALPRLLLVVGVPLLLLVVCSALRRLRRGALLVALVVAVLALVGLRLTVADHAPLWPRSRGGEIAQLDRRFGGGFADAIAFVEAQHRADAPLYLQLGAPPSPAGMEARSHWLRLLPRTVPLPPGPALPQHGLLVRVAWSDASEPGELLLLTKLISIHGLGGQK